MAIFNSYVSLPEGISYILMILMIYDLMIRDTCIFHMSAPPPKNAFMQGFETLLPPTPFL